MVEVEHRGKTHVDPAGAQLGPQHIATGGGRIASGQGAAAGRASVGLHPHLPECAHRWQVGHAIGLKALDPTALMVHQNEQITADRLDLAAQLGELRTVLPVAGKQNHAAGQRMAQAATVRGAELQAGQVDDEGAVGHEVDGHGWLCSTMTKLVA